VVKFKAGKEMEAEVGKLDVQRLLAEQARKRTSREQRQRENEGHR
jgi:hypothetical protein